MTKSNWLSLIETLIKTAPEMLTAIIALLTYLELKNKKDD